MDGSNATSIASACVPWLRYVAFGVSPPAYPTTVELTPGRSRISSSTPQKHPPANIAFSKSITFDFCELRPNLVHSGKPKNKKIRTMKVLDSLFETYKKSVLEKDIKTFASIFDENVRVFDMWGRWTYDGLIAWREMAKNWFAMLGTEMDYITFDDIQIQATGEMAVASAFVRFTAISEKGEQLRYLENRLTWVVRT